MTSPLAPVTAALQGRYAIERELGRGGMATVYLAEDEKLHRRVALKLLHPELGATLGPERFQREIAIAARLTHPHILPLYDSGTAEGRLFYVMPYVEGESLRARLRREPQLPVAETVAILTAVAGALDYAHRAGVIHRDIKPENILLARDPGGGLPHPLVADFGIARALDVAGGERLTETGLVLGTPTYMSPEQASTGGHLDGRSDLYALGCVAYEMLAGAPPFTGPTAQAILSRHAVDPVPSLHTVRTTVPEPVVHAIERALAKVPADRFATAGEFAQALAAEAVPVPSGRRTRDSRRSRRLGGIVAAATAVILAALVGLLRWHGPATGLVAPSATRIAVLPFHAAASDTALTRLARDLAVTVSASLDGVGGVQAADRVSVSAATAGRGDLSPQEATALARRLGARSVLRGTLVRDGSNVRADLDLRDAETDAPLTRAITVTVHHDSLRALTDSLVWALLRQVWRQGEAPTPSLDAVTTRSLPAFRAFLEGERAVERNQWGEAALAYRSAIAADSAFWVAYFRYALAQNWLEQPVEPEYSAAMYRHRETLPDRDRLLVEAWASPDSTIQLLQVLTQRFPDYWPGWFILGDRLYHGGMLLGHDWRETQTVFARAVALNPRLRPAWGHMWLNAIGKDTVESAWVLTRLREQAQTDPTIDPNRFHNSLVTRLSLAAARSRGVITPEVRTLADSLAGDNWERYRTLPQQSEVGAWSPFLNTGYPAAQIDLNRRTLQRGMEGAPAAAQLRGIAWSWAVRGAWDSALATERVALRAKPHPANDQGLTALDDYGLAALGAWLGAVDTAQAVSRRPAAYTAVQRLDVGDWKTEALWTLAWADGMSAFARKDRAALERARIDSRRSGYPLAAFLDRSLATYARALTGDRRAAGRELGKLQDECIGSAAVCGGLIAPNWATDRLAAATWLLEAGDTAQAARLLVWYESLQYGWDMAYNHVTIAFAYLLRARIEEAQGDVRSATEHYEQFLRRFDAPVPAQRHLVEEAKAALTRLSSEGS